ncbi:MAG: chemotaxis protein CheA [Gammaproteobacteria bacterium]
MSIDLDLDEINEIFFEESFEGLDVMETGLLNLDQGDADSEVINDIFRAAHSIKGGAGTFGFMEISEFTHVVETLLDEVRSGTHVVSKSDIQLLLKSVDYLRDTMRALQNKQDVDAEGGEELRQQISDVLSASSNNAIASDEDSVQQEVPSNNNEKVESENIIENYLENQKMWIIKFEPHLNMLQSGNDPLRIFRELETIGELEVEASIVTLPSLDKLSPLNCHLSWDLYLTTEATRDEILEAFDWVMEECDLELIEPKDNSEEVEVEVDIEVEIQEKDKPTAEKKEVKPEQVKANKEPEPKNKAAKSKPAAKQVAKESSSIRVSIEKVDALLDLVGELVITQSMLKRFGSEYDEDSLKELGDGLTQLERYTRELQENVMDIRMLPISSSFNRFPRLVHDISGKLGKKVDLKLSGEHTELDKTVLEKIGDPLVHLVRNSLDHGIETPDVRVAAGKPETGTLHLYAFQEGGNIVIRVEDDGAGINTEKILAKAREKGLVGADENLSDDRINNLIFHPGLSTNDEVSDLSGRGVGMDVVRRNIKDLGGRVEIHSERGVGSVLTIRLPLTLAILDGQLVRCGKETYIISLLSIVETVMVSEEQVNDVAGGARVYQMRGNYIPIISLNNVFKHEHNASIKNKNSGLLVVVESDGAQVGILVDELLDQQQVVIKSLEDNFKQMDGLSGATILGDGTVALILDVPGFVQSFLTSDMNKVSPQKHAA